MKKRPKPKRRTATKAAPTVRSPRESRVLTIVAIGASAGGLEALEQFLKNVEPASPWSFVVVQHLDPTHKAMLAELLQHVCALPVVEVRDQTRILPGHVYVIPPNKDMSIVRGVLHLFVPLSPRGLRLPIDFFFQSLALDFRERSIGVVLSGMGADGTLGLQSIREHAGAVFVQSPASARFDGMPRSAIDAGLADVVAPAFELPAKIAEYLRHARSITGPVRSPPNAHALSALEKIVGLLRSAIGHDFTLYKSSTLYRRIERRMGLHKIDAIANYVRYLRENPKELGLLFQELLIGVTSFFRDRPAWDRLSSDILPALLASCPENASLKAWVPACSTGEEAYSLAIVFKEAMEQSRAKKKISLQIFATDLDSHAIEKARQGFYPESVASEVSPERLRRFFDREQRGYRVRGEIRDLVIFATQNILQDPPFTRLDLLTCRNLLIYLVPEVQNKLISMFHYCLKPQGILFLGTAETVGAPTHLFAAQNGKSRLYRRIEATAGAGMPSDFPAAFMRSRNRDAAASAGKLDAPVASTVPNLQALVEQFLLKRFAPAAILATSTGDVLYVSGRTGKYLELPAGKANWNVLAMARDEIRHPLGSAFQKAMLLKSAVTASGVKVLVDGRTQSVQITVEPLDEPPALLGTAMIVFVDGAESPAQKLAQKSKPTPLHGPGARRLELELTQAREELLTTREEMQTSEEELKSANEELQSTNEELQSTNEELTTSKEEMQSMNEELQTLNHELQGKVDELSHLNSDMKNLLDSTEIAVLFLDEELNVRRFTPQMTPLFKLIPGDIGRPLADLASNLAYPELCEDAREVLRSLAFKERVASTQNGRWFRVRAMPYRSSDNRIEGVVITFTDIKPPGVGER